MIKPFKSFQHPRHGKGQEGGQFKEAPTDPVILVQRAKEFATWAHASINQKRKYSGDDYIFHPAAVVELVKSVPHTPEMLAAAWLHDTVEDVHIPLSQIRARFGDKVAALVYWLTDYSEDTGMPRAQRKAMDRERLSRAPAAAQTVKYADLIHNFQDIAKFDPKFLKVYGDEKRELLKVMTKGSQDLFDKAMILAMGVEKPEFPFKIAIGTKGYVPPQDTLDQVQQNLAATKTKFGTTKATIYPTHVEYPGLFGSAVNQLHKKYGVQGFHVPAAPPKPPEPLDMSKLKKVGNQMGSNPGGVYQDDTGKKFYIKKGQTPAHVKNEMIAANLAWRAGAKVLKYRKVVGGDWIATEMQELTKNHASQLTQAEIKMAQEDFMVHAWLGNYDSIGTGGDNVGIPKGHSRPVALDLGGALEFRPQGKPKGDRFGNKVDEYDDMRNPDPNLPQFLKDAYKIYGGMTLSQLRSSSWKVLDMKDEEIREIVNKWGGSKALADKLIARREDIARRLTRLGEQGDPDSPKGTIVFPIDQEHPVKELNGIPFAAWEPPEDWNQVEGQNPDLEEAPLAEPPPPPQTKFDYTPADLGIPAAGGAYDVDDYVPYSFPGTVYQPPPVIPGAPPLSSKASGLVIREPDGRIWLVRPRNGYGGYAHTFPKGRLEGGLNPQANAIKEAWEESGIKARITGIVGDFKGDVTNTRYYLAERMGGDPTLHQNESDGVLLVPPGRLGEFLNKKRDLEISAQILGETAALGFREHLVIMLENEYMTVEGSPTMKTDHRQNAVEVLTGAGYKASGQTPQETVKFMVNAGHGYPSFKGATFGGRDRYVHPSGHRATVGRNTVNFYQSAPTGKLVGPKYQTYNFKGYRTKDLEGIKDELKTRHGV